MERKATRSIECVSPVTPRVFRRVLAKCGTCKMDWTLVPDVAKTTEIVCAGLPVLKLRWFDCACGSGLIVGEIDGRQLTEPELTIEFCKRGLK